MSGQWVPKMGALAGLKVVELAGIGPAPYCGMLLADHGAEVIRVERPGARLTADGIVLNRNRRSVLLDMKDARGVEAVLALIDRADVLIEGFRPGVAERIGVGPEVCLERNPGLVYARMTGWGQSGDDSHRAGHDINFLARSGALHAIGEEGGPPRIPLNVIGDFGGGGMMLAFSIMTALWERAGSGCGQVIDAAIIDGVASQLAMTYGLRAQGLWSDERGTNLFDSGSPYYNVYRCADGRWYAVGAVEEQFYNALVAALALEDLPDRRDRTRWPDLKARFAERFAQRTQREWQSILDTVDACATPVQTLSEAAIDPGLATRGTYVSDNGVEQPGIVPSFGRSSPPPLRPSVVPGTHTRETLAEWGVPNVEELIVSGIATDSSITTGPHFSSKSIKKA